MDNRFQKQDAQNVNNGVGDRRDSRETIELRSIRLALSIRSIGLGVQWRRDDGGWRREARESDAPRLKSMSGARRMNKELESPLRTVWRMSNYEKFDWFECSLIFTCIDRLREKWKLRKSGFSFSASFWRKLFQKIFKSLYLFTLYTLKFFTIYILEQDANRKNKLVWKKLQVNDT